MRGHAQRFPRQVAAAGEQQTVEVVVDIVENLQHPLAGGTAHRFLLAVRRQTPEFAHALFKTIRKIVGVFLYDRVEEILLALKISVKSAGGHLGLPRDAAQRSRAESLPQKFRLAGAEDIPQRI